MNERMIRPSGTPHEPITVGVDVGGTFTDAVLVRGTEVTLAKVPSTPDDQSLGVIEAVEAVRRAAGYADQPVDRFAHGMTVATNALLEGKGAETAFITTKGFGDLLELRRQDRAHMYRLDAHHPPPVVPRNRVIEVAERSGPEGVITPLGDDEVARVVAAIGQLGVSTVAVCFLFSHLYPDHEARIAAAIRSALPEVHVSASHEVLPAVREYERAATTCADAYLNPVMRGYLERLSERTARAGLPDAQIMMSSGGLTDTRTAACHAVRTVLSGPVGGVMGVALTYSDRDDESTAPDTVITFDMGGTSCDVAVIENGRPNRTHGTQIGGRPLHLPMLDIVTVSAGGGSIAWVDSGGALRVGPHSAGAQPGPAGYGHGGTEPTVTDANIVTGRLDPTRGLAGGVTLDIEAARIAVATLAEKAGMSLDDCAHGIITVANQEMARAVRRVSVERGIDPRGAMLVAFGGAGPLHACDVADEVGASRVVVPGAAGMMAALGLVMVGERRDAVRAFEHIIDGRATVSHAAQRIGEELAHGATDVTHEYRASCRYVGQRHELAVEWDPNAGDQALTDAFHAAHRRNFGQDRPGHPVQVLAIEVAVRSPDSPIPRDVTVTGHIEGPTSMPRQGSTVWLSDGWSAICTADGDLEITRKETTWTP